MNKYIIENKEISIEEFLEVVENDYYIETDNQVLNKIQESRQILDDFVNEGRIIYGVNTSMGGFVNYLVPVEHASVLQQNLLKSVASNVGEYFDKHIVRSVMIARLLSLSKGVSAITLKNYKILQEMINKRIYPCIPEKGSLGASGDLGPLAFIALVATGKWKALYQGKIMSGKDAMNAAGIELMELSYKEGLALINGTSAMVGLAAENYKRAKTLFENYIFISGLSFEGLETKIKPFVPEVHERKKHSGQLAVAKKIVKILSSSRLIVDEATTEKFLKEKFDNTVKGMDRQIEDAYSIRCTPQILGPVSETLDFIKEIITNELNSSSDNPLVIPEHGDVFHNGHFHGQYISLSMDFLSICMTTLSNLSDRRIDRFMDASNSNGLPAFLCRTDPGLRMGLMGGQFMSTSITAENRSLCTPVSTQTLTSTGDFQDIVSFGLVAARRARDIIENAGYIIAFELLCSCHAIDMRGKDKMSIYTRPLYAKVREILPYNDDDFIITDYCEEIKNLVLDNGTLNKLNSNLL
jgi:phenylalanine and histidine ammonia-lyase